VLWRAAANVAARPPCREMEPPRGAVQSELVTQGAKGDDRCGFEDGDALKVGCGIHGSYVPLAS